MEDDNKVYTIMAIIGGVLSALILCVVVMYMYFAFRASSKIDQNDQVVLTYYDTELIPFIRANLESACGNDLGYQVEEDSKVYDNTTFGQHINKNGDIELLGKVASDFTPIYGEANNDNVLLNRMVRKLYINITPKNVILPKDGLENFYRNNTFTEYIATGLYIRGLDTLEDYNSLKISNELRFAILGFVKVYMGMLNLNEVSVENTSDDVAPSFILRIPNGYSYTFQYNVDMSSESIQQVTVNVAKGE